MLKNIDKDTKIMFLSCLLRKLWRNLWFANSAISNLATLLSDGLEIASVRFPESENILVDTKTRFLSLLDDTFSQKMEKNGHFGLFFEILLVFG